MVNERLPSISPPGDDDDSEYPVSETTPVVSTTDSDIDTIKEELYKKYTEGKLAEYDDAPISGKSDEYPVSYQMGTDYSMDSSRHLMPSQIQMRYLLDPDDVPPHINKKLWSIVSRHLELINITSEREIPFYQRRVRNIIRTACWRRDMKNIPFSDIEGIEFYSTEILLRKSIKHAERLALMTTIQRSQVEEFGERSPSGGGYGGGGGGGFWGSIRNFIGGRR
jgi:hypothetical protein